MGQDEDSDPGGYYSALGHVTESAGTLEYLIYLIADRVLELKKVWKQPASRVLDGIGSSVQAQGLASTLPTDVVGEWVESCKGVLEQRNSVVHVVSVYDGTLKLEGVRRTSSPVEPLRLRSSHHLQLLNVALKEHTAYSSEMYSLLSHLRTQKDPGWQQRLRPVMAESPEPNRDQGR